SRQFTYAFVAAKKGTATLNVGNPRPEKGTASSGKIMISGCWERLAAQTAENRKGPVLANRPFRESLTFWKTNPPNFTPRNTPSAVGGSVNASGLGWLHGPAALVSQCTCCAAQRDRSHIT